MYRVYVAGAIQGKDLLSSFTNIRNGIKLSVEVLQAGYSPFSPFIDFQFSLVKEITIEQYYAYSMSWLEVADAVLLVPGYEDSKGTAKEIARARELNIPVFVTLSGLDLHFDNVKAINETVDNFLGIC